MSLYDDPNLGLYPSLLSDGAGGAFYVCKYSSKLINAHRISGDGSKLWGNSGIALGGQTSLVFRDHNIVGIDGDLGIVWQDSLSSVTTRIVAQRLDGNSGNILWSADGEIVHAMDGTIRDIDVSKLSDGKLAVGWSEYLDGDSRSRIRVQKIDGNGNLAWAGSGALVSSVAGLYNPLILVAGAAGDAIVFWADARFNESDGGLFGVRASKVRSDGALGGVSGVEEWQLME